MTLVSDFDGVWTKPDEEAAAQGNAIDSHLAAWLPGPMRPRLDDWLARARVTVAAHPTRYGWAPGGRLSAFGDEDPFTAHSGLLHHVHLESAADPIAAAIVQAVDRQGLTLEAFGSRCHAEGVASVVARRGPGVLPAAARAGRALLDRGMDIAVVSNSGPEKLGMWFAHAGVPAVRHPARDPGALRLRGDSRKFAIDPERSDMLVLGEVRIETARPSYERALREERPTAVVGDVFSLDLALPLVLRRREPGWRDVRLFWLLQPYTPTWLRELVERHADGEVEPIEGGLAAVAAALGADLRAAGGGEAPPA